MLNQNQMGYFEQKIEFITWKWETVRICSI